MDDPPRAGDLNEEVRGRVLVVSIRRINRLSGRVLVAPEIFGLLEDVTSPWRVQVDDATYAVDLVRRLPVERLLDRVDRAPAVTMQAVQRTLGAIT